MASRSRSRSPCRRYSIGTQQASDDESDETQAYGIELMSDEPSTQLTPEKVCKNSETLSEFRRNPGTNAIATKKMIEEQLAAQKSRECFVAWANATILLLPHEDQDVAERVKLGGAGFAAIVI